MLPKVHRDVRNQYNSIINPIGVNGSNHVVRMLLTTPESVPGESLTRLMTSNRGRRAISTKSANFTTIPLEPTLLSSPSVNFPQSQGSRNNIIQPFSRQTTNPHLKAGSNGFRARAQSHKLLSSAKSYNGKGVGSLAKGPAAVPKSGKQKGPPFPASVVKIATSSSNSQETKQEDSGDKLPATTSIQLVGGMVLLGSGKPGVSVNGNGVGGAVSSLTKDRVQVCRTKEERDKNPDSIRLDKRGVRVFPDIGGGESVTLKLLSLQHNLLTKLENVPLLSQLVVLDLYDNRVERINGLQGLPSLRVLLLGKNRIKRIEGLDCLKRLEILDLHGNQLRYVDNLGGLSALRVLNLAGNLLRNIRNLGPYGMTSLTELNLKRNRIKNLDGLQKAPHLKKLLLANNDIQSMAALAPLRKLLFLNELVVEPNPLISQVGGDYHCQILTLFPNLSSLDRNVVSEEMKQAARLWHKKKLEDDERRKQEEERIREQMAQNVGPPGSREQVIFQARQRWESVKNFVKSGPSNENVVHHKKAIKSMKKVAAAAVDGNAKRKAELLYPPATLDLEDFPDGREKFEQTESLMGSNNEKQLIEENNYKSHNAPQFEPEVQAKVDSEVNLQYQIFADEERVTSNELNTVAVVRTDQVVAEKDVVLVQDFRNNVSPCPSSNSSRSAKLAVVRPLIHQTFNPNEDTDDLETNAKTESKDTEAPGPVMDRCAQQALYVKNDDTQPSSPLGETPNVEKQNFSRDNPSSVEILDGSVQKMEVIRESSKEQECSPAVVLTEPTPKIQHENKLTLENEIPIVITKEECSSQMNAAGVKSKLLKHLRSMSLDSYQHPFLRPDTSRREDNAGESPSVKSASPVVPSEDDCEEEDDNDDEVIQDYDEDDFSIATSTSTTVTSGSTPRSSNAVMGTTNRLLKGAATRKQQFPRTRSQRLKIKDRAAKIFASELSPRSSNVTPGKRISSGTGIRGDIGSSVKPPPSSRVLRRCDSAASLSTPGSISSSNSNLGTSSALSTGGKSVSNGHLAAEPNDPSASNPNRKQGVDFLVEIEGKLLNIFGQGGLRHALTAFASNVTCHVNTAKFHYISYDSIIPFFGKLRQVYPSLEHFHFRANNLCILSQLDALSDLQGLTSLSIAKEGNPLVKNDAWVNYASYRLSHWGLQMINGKEMSSDYRTGSCPSSQAKGFESLGFLALSCLPQTALTPLAKRLHMLHCFCCCSPSTSSEESNRRQPNNRAIQASASQATSSDHSSSNFCTAWDDDPVLLDVIGKEALVYCPPVLPPDAFETIDSSGLTPITKDPPKPLPISPSPFEKKRSNTLSHLIDSGVTIVEKIDMLEKVWPTLMTQVIQEMLMDYRFMDSYMKKELKKCVDITLINQQHPPAGQHSKKHRF